MFRTTDATADEPVAMETANPYCGHNLFEIEQKMTNQLRKMYIVCCATFVFCLVSLVACGCCIYLYTETARMQKEAGPLDWKPLLNEGEYEEDYSYDFLTSDDEYTDVQNENRTTPEIQSDQHREKRKDKDGSKSKGNINDKPKNTNQEKRKRGRGNRAIKYIKRLDKKLKDLQKSVAKVRREVRSIRNSSKPPIQTTTLNPTTVAKENTQQQNFIPHVAAAHYTSFVDNEYIRSNFPPIDQGHMERTQACLNKPGWNGLLCRNRTLITSVAPTRLNVFKEAEWMKNISSQQVFDMNDGVFHAKHTGIYLVYAHVLFYDSRKTQAIELVHASGGKDPNKFRCVQSTEKDVPQPGFARDTEYMSCSVNTVMFLEKHDTIEILNLFPNSSVDLSPGSTYFGGLVFVNVND